jgi:hypothetical protein
MQWISHTVKNDATYREMSYFHWKLVKSQVIMTAKKLKKNTGCDLYANFMEGYTL